MDNFDFNRQLDAYVDSVLYPAMAANLTAVFPTLRLTQKGGSGYYYSDTDLNGQQHRGETVLFCKYGQGRLTIGANNPEKAGIAQYAKAGASGVDAIALWRALNGNPTYTEAVKQLADLVGASLATYPQGSGFVYDVQPAEDRDTARDAFVAALWSDTPEAAAALAYLRNDKGYTDAELTEAGIGLATPSVLTELERVAPKWYPRTGANGEQLPTAAAQGIGSTWVIAIPMQYGTKVDSFNFRTVGAAPEGKPKYKIPAGQRRDVFSGLAAGTRESLILVEGELDALKARVNGHRNVVSYGMNYISLDKARNAVARGITKFTIVPDTDTKEGVASTDQPGVKNLPQSIANLYEAGATEVYVAPLQPVANETTGKAVKDTEEYIATFGVDAWHYAVKAAQQRAATYLVDRAFIRYQEKGNYSVEDRRALLAELEAIAVSRYTNYLTLTDVYQRVGEWMSYPGRTEYFGFDLDAFKVYVNGRKDREAEQLHQVALTNDIARAQELATSGKTKEAAELMRESLGKNTGTSRSDYADLFTAPTDPERDITNIPEGLHTGLYFLTAENDIQELTLKEGVSLLVGARKHGKTTLLCNFALNEAKRNVEAWKAGTDTQLRKVVLFSYEVTKARLYQKLLAIYLNNQEIGKNSARSILSYYKGNEADYFQGGAEGRGFADFLARKDAFYTDYIKSGAITIVTNEQRNLSVEELTAALEALLASHKVSLVCIDYIQKLHSSQQKNTQRTEELKYIGEVLSNFANPHALPMLCAAQFNRQIGSLLDVRTENIGEAGDIERNGVDVLGIFNLKELRYLAAATKDIIPGNREILQRFGIEGAIKPYDLGEGKTTENLAPCPGKVYISLMASRFDEAPAEIITDFVGATGYVDLAGTKGIATAAQTGLIKGATGEDKATKVAALKAELKAAEKAEKRLAEAEQKADIVANDAEAVAIATRRDANKAQTESRNTTHHTGAELLELREKAATLAAQALTDEAAAKTLRGKADVAKNKRLKAGEEILRISNQLRALEQGESVSEADTESAQDVDELFDD